MSITMLTIITFAHSHLLHNYDLDYYRNIFSATTILYGPIIKWIVPIVV